MLISKIVFIGTPDFAVPSLSKLAGTKFKPQLVITQPDRPKGRKKKLTQPPIKVCADSFGIETLQPEDVNDEQTMKRLTDFQPDIIITVAYGGYLKKDIRVLPKLGCINLHPSLLPKFRGPAPVNYTLFSGDTITGNTIFKIRAKIDSGKILYQTETKIGKNENYTKLQDRLAKTGADDLVKCLQLLEDEKIIYKSQNHAKATFTEKIQKSDTFINWQKMDAERIMNIVKGLADKPGAVISFREKRMKLINVKLAEDNSNKEPGTIIDFHKKQGIQVSTLTNDILIQEVQPAGKQIMTALAYNLGARVKMDEKFENGY